MVAVSGTYGCDPEKHQVHCDAASIHRPQPKDALFGMVCDVVPTAKFIFVELQVEFVRIGEGNFDLFEAFHDLVTPATDARSRYG